MVLRARVMAAASALAATALMGLPSEASAAYTCFGKTATIVGSNSGTTIKGTPKSDVIVARGGNDTIFGYGGDDLICGGDGADVIDGGAGNDRIEGGPGWLTTDASGAKVVRNDTLIGGPGDDFFSPGFDGRAKPADVGDRISFATATGPVRIDSATQQATGDGNDSWIGMRAAILGSPYDDTFIGSDQRDVFNGMAGSDVINGAGGDDTLRDDDPDAERQQPDTLHGGEGNDQLFTWGGFDTLSGGPGNDTLYDYGRDAGVMQGEAGDDVIYDGLGADPLQVVDGGDGQDQVLLYTDFTVQNRPRLQVDMGLGQAQLQLPTPVTFRLAGAEDLQVYGFGVTYYGTPGNDRIGSDGTGAMHAEGRAGDDYLIGTYLDDFLDGGPGIDTALPGRGTDTCLSIESIPAGSCG